MKSFYKLWIMLLFILITLPFIHPVNAELTLEPLMRDGSSVKHFWSTEEVMIPTTYTEKSTEFRGVWVATVYNLNMPVHTSETQYKTAFLDLINEVLESNMNAMLFQVRPLNDAFYDSAYAPWSRYLTGTEGSDPGWDVLSWMITTAHNNGIEFHAWMNPYRVANTTSDKTTYLNSLHEDNWAKQNPDMVVSGDVDSHGRTPLILNPGEPAVKQYIQDVVAEIMTNYDVDGIHFDDYFYPYSGISSDTDTYNSYKLVGQTIEDWRRENVNDVVQGVHTVVGNHNSSAGKTVEFGISPFGLWGSGIEGYAQYLEGGSNTGPTNLSSYIQQFADSKKWVEEGWLDYINPQVYWDFTHSTAPYADVVDWWASIARGTGVDVFIGHAPSAASSSGWPTEAISEQLRYNQKHPEIKGEVMYSAAFLDHAHMQYVETNNWTTTPLNVWDNNNPDVDVTIDGPLNGNIYTDDVTVTLSAVDDIYYRLDDGIWTLYSSPINVTGELGHVLYYKTHDGTTESSVSSINIPIQYQNTDVPVIDITGSMIDDNYVLGSTITITATEDIYVKINHGSVGEFQLYTEPITLNDTGSYYIVAKTIDSRGTESEETTLSVTLQEACYDAPLIDITGVGNPPNYQSVTITLTSDTTVLYKLDDGTWHSYTTPIDVTTEGAHTIYYKNDDACADEYSDIFTIDNTVPNVPTLTVTGDYDGSRYYTSETTLTLTTEETTADIYYRLHNGSTWSSWTLYIEPIDLLFTANYTLEYKTRDQALNESDVTSELIRLQLPATEDNLYVIRDGQIVTYYNTDTPIELPTEYTEKTEEIRAIWIATVSNIDIGLYTTETQYKQAIIDMLDTIEQNNFNTIFFQVRPMNDAFYDSSYAPWSRYLTGTEGVDPGWDILAFFIEESHRRGIEFHAWLNPYRVSSGTDSKATQLATLHNENFAKEHPEFVIQDNAGKLILNPGERQVQIYIQNVIQELISRYDIDGIHFDDYFYSYGGIPTSADETLYNNTKEANQTLDDWRRENINTVIREVYELIETYNLEENKTIMFGISPFGIWQSGGTEGSNTASYALQSYSDQYADSKKWVEEGWVHYILPQLYWEFDHSAAPFADLVDWWANLTNANNVDLIIGHGFYRYDDDSWDNDNELLEQLRYISQYDSVIGSSFFTYNTLLSTDPEVVQAIDRLNHYYWTEYATFPWESNVEKEVPLVCDSGYHEEDGVCVEDELICDPGYHEEEGNCVEDELICDLGYHEEDGACIEDVEEPTCPEGYEPIEGGCQLIEEEGLSTGIVVAISVGSATVLGGVLFFFRKMIFKI
ncbi:MAG: family 10 glycosylhydrolase [Candidatus Izimaplasma sp.]|nr:family 10 glycosylhydrolase [Candidatus Izimaplasma bacterium]